MKYDSWHKEVLSKFGQMLGQNMQDFHAQISKVKITHYDCEIWFCCSIHNSLNHVLIFDFFFSSLSDFSAFLQSRQELEQHSVDTASTSDAVNFITYVQTLKRKIKQFEKNVDVRAYRPYILKKYMYNLYSHSLGTILFSN